MKDVTRTGTDLDVARNNSSGEDTQGDAGFLRGSESINISSCSGSVCVSKMLFNASAEVSAQGCRYSASGSA